MIAHRHHASASLIGPLAEVGWAYTEETTNLALYLRQDLRPSASSSTEDPFRLDPANGPPHDEKAEATYLAQRII